MEQSSIFRVNAVTDISLSGRIGPSMYIGWFPSFDAAEAAVFSFNDKDRFYHLFDWFVIEENPSGVFKQPIAHTWYRYRSGMHGYVYDPVMTNIPPQPTFSVN